MKPIALGLDLILAAAVVGCGGDKDFSDVVSDIRNDPDFQHREQELRDLTGRCIQTGSKATCLKTFSDSAEKTFHACFVVYPGNLCALEIDVIAKVKAWTVDEVDREGRLLSDETFTSPEKECVAKHSVPSCFPLLIARIERDFNICDDFWGGGSCSDVLADIKSHAKHEEGWPTKED